MSELGQFLKQSRLEKEISLEKLQEVTKIRKRYLEAIEEGQHSVLPGPFYARAFVKSYAEALNLNADKVLEQFKDELPSIPQTPVEPMPSRRRRIRNTASPKLGKWVSRLMAYAFLILVVAVIWFAFAYWFDPPERAPEEAAPRNVGVEEGEAQNGENGDNGDVNDDETVDENGEEEAVEPEPEEEPVPEQSIELVDSTPQTSTYLLTGAEEMVVTLQVTTEDVWFRLIDVETNSQIDEATLRQGDERTWDLSEYAEVQFRFGNTTAIEIFINDEPMELEDLPRVHNIRIQFEQDES